MTDYRSFIEKALQQASAIALKSFGSVAHVSVKTGDNNQVLTEADLAVGDLLVSKVEKNFPDHNIIDEEAGVIDKNARFTWVIDPIDGTSNFAAGLPTFGIMIGLLDKNIPVAGGIVLPALDELYVAQEGKGTTLNGRKVTVTDDSITNTLIAYQIDGHPEEAERTYAECKIFAEIVLRIRNARNTGSAFDIASVAKGAYGGVLNQTSKIWDNVAPQIIIEEAGGIYTDFWGGLVDYSKVLQEPEVNYMFCAGAPQIHAELVEITAKYR